MDNEFFNDLKNNRSDRFFLIAGPCVVENEAMPMEIAEYIRKITDRLEIPFIFKASYQKANRSRVDSFTGIGHEKALQLIGQVGKSLNIPVLTDIHTEEQAAMAASYVDILQIPAFLCRQTELLIAAGNTGKAVNIKKGQFASAESMKYAVQKVLQTGNAQIMLTERGTTFGYNDLVVDFRNIPDMQANGVPVIVDITHSLQQPNQSSGITGGRPDLIETIAKAAIAVGADGIFIETHPEPGNAKSDGANMLQMDLLEELLEKLVKIRKAIY
ncbi:MAG: 3-deoxy-8-phosphooctulonate synthase [Bacteroidales bacterium]